MMIEFAQLFAWCSVVLLIGAIGAHFRRSQGPVLIEAVGRDAGNAARSELALMLLVSAVALSAVAAALAVTESIFR